VDQAVQHVLLVAGLQRLDGRLEVVVGQQLVGLGVPGVAREVVAQHRAVALGLVQQAQGQVALDQAVEGFGGVRGGLVAVDHGAEPADGRQGLAVAQVVAADGHFLAGQLVADHVDLQAGVLGVFRVGIALDHVAQRGHGLLGGGLVAVDVDDLLEIADGLQIVGVRGRRVARIQADEAVGVRDRLVVLVALIVGVAGHQNRAARPFRIGVLALDLAEVVDGLVPAAAVQAVGAGRIEQLHRALFIGQGRLLALAGAGGDRQGDQHGGRDHGGLASREITKHGLFTLEANVRPCAVQGFYTTPMRAQMEAEP
jgi:hypothetical protein